MDMMVDMESRHGLADRASLDGSGTQIQAACSSNGSGGEDDESEALERSRESGDSSCLHAGDGEELSSCREQEVTVDIGETYLCQRADKTWREYCCCML